MLSEIDLKEIKENSHDNFQIFCNPESLDYSDFKEKNIETKKELRG